MIGAHDVGRLFQTIAADFVKQLSLCWPQAAKDGCPRHENLLHNLRIRK
jgi:hypothetical protein